MPLTKNISDSFSSADAVVPVKLLRNSTFIQGTQCGVIRPIHIQWMPTNVCDQKCSFCSCSERDKKMSLDIDRSREAIEMFARLGTKAVTITGGGEPMLYPHISALMDTFKKNGIEMGLVTNGLAYSHWDYARLDNLRWLRMSISDEYDFDGFEEKIKHIKAYLPTVDIALSYVLTKDFSRDKMIMAMRVTNENNLSHIRFVSDILNSDTPMRVDVESILNGLDTSRAIIQQRSKYTQGQRSCNISLAKPVIAADGNIYPCCGVQYAQGGGSRSMTESFSMGTIEDAETIWRTQQPFNGSRCDKCYYGGYNATIGNMIDYVRHEQFI